MQCNGTVATGPTKDDDKLGSVAVQPEEMDRELGLVAHELGVNKSLKNSPQSL